MCEFCMLTFFFFPLLKAPRSLGLDLLFNGLALPIFDSHCWGDQHSAYGSSILF